MSAIMDRAAEELQLQIENFAMPKPKRGQAVLWFPNGDRNDSTEIAFIEKAGRRNVMLRMASGLPRETVRHIDDPKLEMSEMQRENGAWDFTEDSKDVTALKAEVAELKAALAELRSDLNRKKKPE